VAPTAPTCRMVASPIARLEFGRRRTRRAALRLRGTWPRLSCQSPDTKNASPSLGGADSQLYQSDGSWPSKPPVVDEIVIEVAAFGSAVRPDEDQ